jgi:cephalosporin hydroxylase
MRDKEFDARNTAHIAAQSADAQLQAVTSDWYNRASRHEYSYHFSWMGRPIIQFPQDIVAVQEIIWNTRPDLIIECGIARGGSLILYASLLELLGGSRQVLGIDVDIREINRGEIEAHPMFKNVTMIEGSSVDRAVVEQVQEIAAAHRTIMLVLDSNHTHDHVKQELELYSPLVSAGCYLVVFDTVIEDLPPELCQDRPWGRGNSPKTAVREFLATNKDFEIDEQIHQKLLITAAPEGYLKCVRNRA